MRTFFSFAFILTLIFGCTFSVAWAQPKAMCEDKVLESGTFEAIYSDFTCGDFCYATFLLGNGEEYSLGCGEEEILRILFLGSNLNPPGEY